MLLNLKYKSRKRKSQIIFGMVYILRKLLSMEVRVYYFGLNSAKKRKEKQEIKQKGKKMVLCQSTRSPIGHKVLKSQNAQQLQTLQRCLPETTQRMAQNFPKSQSIHLLKKRPTGKKKRLKSFHKSPKDAGRYLRVVKRGPW